MIGKIVRVKLTKAGYPYNEGQYVRVIEEQEDNRTKYKSIAVT